MQVNLAASGIRHTTRTETLNQYFNDIPKKAQLTTEETIALYKEYKNATNPVQKERLKNKIINANLLFVISIAKRYANEGTLMDVIQEGNIGLVRALDSFNPDKEVNFITYAVNFIVREINDYKTRFESLVRQRNSCKTYHIQARAREVLFKEYGREPSLEEIKEYINSNYERYTIKNASDLVSVKMTYVDDTASKDSDSPSNASDIAEFNAYSASYNDCINTEERDHKTFITTSLLNKLKPIEQQVIKYAFGIDCFREYTNAEIAEKLDYTPERIRQIKEDVLKRLKKSFISRYSVA